MNLNDLIDGSSRIILYGNGRNIRGVMGRTSDARFPSLIDAVQSFDQVHDGRKSVGLTHSLLNTISYPYFIFMHNTSVVLLRS